MKDKLVTLIGGGGFLGRYTAQALLREGARVRIVQRRPGRAFFLKPLGGLGQTQFVAADIKRPQSIARAVQGSDAVVNLVGAWRDLEAIQAQGAGTVAEAAAAAGVTDLVHVSAIGADADAPSAYGRSKAAGEARVRAALPEAVILRPSVLFGREDEFTNRFAGLIAQAPIVPVLKPNTRLQPLFVGDAADAIVAALRNPAARGRIYEIAGPDALTMAALFRWIGGAIGRQPLYLDLPDAVGALIPLLPGAPISRDQWRALGRDAVPAPGAEGLAALGITPAPLASIAPSWLVRYRRLGRFAHVSAA